ncbi:peptidoglycan-binding protein [Streptomyces asiaticus]|uniref:peptidoglycan-binding protein n=1 Tax=Streptomyces asiaticus TaxID=114695 RepID=UPI0027E3661B|nr:peptidoglycan-binding protein [Streptomyces asiaticus]
MTDLWMPGAARHAVGNTGTMNGGPARAVWHITSNAHDWTFRNELGWFTGGGRDVAPHLLWDPFTGQIAQFFPADSRSLSLENAGSVKTNRTGTYCIQVETVFTQGETVNGKKYATVRDTPCKGLDQIMAWLRGLGIPDVWPGGAPTGFARDTVPMDTWLKRGGHYGHNQAPGNRHVDPGPMPDLFATSPSKSPSSPKYEPFPGGDWFTMGRKSPIVAAMHDRLVAVGCNHYQSSKNKNVIGSGDKASYEAWQRKCGYSGADAKWPPGKTTWDRLKVPNA